MSGHAEKINERLPIDHGFLTDVSHGCAALRISGPHARNLLAKGCSIDLHPRVFKPGSAATTRIAQIGCLLWQVDETPTYDLAVNSSIARSLWTWLANSAAEYGYQVALSSRT